MTVNPPPIRKFRCGCVIRNPKYPSRITPCLKCVEILAPFHSALDPDIRELAWKAAKQHWNDNEIIDQ